MANTVTYHFKSILDITRNYKDHKTCIKFLEHKYWGENCENVKCPYCESKCCRRHENRWQCKDCRKGFSVLNGTIFQSTKLPLYKWFIAIYMVNSYKKGVSSIQLAQDLECTQKTAWYIMQKINYANRQDDNLRLLFAQCDETYMGGREKNKHKSRKTKGTQGRSYKTKTPVFGMVDIFGNAVVKVVDDTTKGTLHPIIQHYVMPNSRVWTDEYNAYRGLSKLGFKHEIVCHKQCQFVKWNKVNTNAIEGLWGIMKRMVCGIHHFVSRKYLQRYIDEIVFQHNTLNLTIDQKFDRFFDNCIGVDWGIVMQRRIKKLPIVAPKVFEIKKVA